MNNIIKSAVVFLTMAISAVAQLTVTSVPIDPLASAMKANTGFVNSVLLNIGAASGTFTFNSATFNQIGAPNLNFFQTGTNSSGTYSLTASYLTQDAGHKNVFQANLQNSPFFVDLFANKNPTPANTTLNITSTNGSQQNVYFTNHDTNTGLITLQNDPTHFRWYQGAGSFQSYYVGFVDDLGTSLVDHNDLVVLVRQTFTPSQNLPIDSSPIPEPSTYGLLGALSVMGLVGYRRFAKKK